MRHAKPKEFWKLFSKHKKATSNISLNQFFEYFSNLQNNLSTAQDRESEDFCLNSDLDTDDRNFEELDRPITAQVQF